MNSFRASPELWAWMEREVASIIRLFLCTKCGRTVEVNDWLNARFRLQMKLMLLRLLALMLHVQQPASKPNANIWMGVAHTL